ncbi:hypothetical protein BFJ70_g13314 [Fusarium oxysporum]|nr:hypothetical protein BFJ70_g13314 [Fusarium oxysporum]
MNLQTTQWLSVTTTKFLHGYLIPVPMLQPPTTDPIAVICHGFCSFLRLSCPFWTRHCPGPASSSFPKAPWWWQIIGFTNSTTNAASRGSRATTDSFIALPPYQDQTRTFISPNALRNAKKAKDEPTSTGGYVDKIPLNPQPLWSHLRTFGFHTPTPWLDLI